MPGIWLHPNLLIPPPSNLIYIFLSDREMAFPQMNKHAGCIGNTFFFCTCTVGAMFMMMAKVIAAVGDHEST